MGKWVFLAALLVLASSASSRAATLVVMAVNTNPGIAGARTFTIGVQIYQSDLLRPGAGAHPTLTIHDFGFLAGNTAGPIQALAAGNVPDIQTAWNTLDLDSPNSITNGGPGGPSFPPGGASASTQLYKDSWWYSSPTGTLQGINGFLSDGSADTVGPVTTHDFGQGVYAQGPGTFVGTTGYLWSPVATGITGGASSGAAVGFSGVFGPGGGIDLTSPEIASQFSSGVLTIPLMQVIAKGGIFATSNYDQGQYISIGGATFNFAGQDEETNADHLQGQVNFSSSPNERLFIIPEPGTLTLMALGMLSAIFARRCARRSVRL